MVSGKTLLLLSSCPLSVLGFGPGLIKTTVFIISKFPEGLSRDNLTPFNFNKNKTGIISASIKNNEVSVKTSRVTEFTFYIYPELIDVSKPIKFKVNDKIFFKVIPETNKEDLMAEFTKTKDRTMLPIEKVILGVDD